MKIYTRTGDDGSTGLLGGDRTSKTHARIAAIGDIDELNSAIGLARAANSRFTLDPRMRQVQCRLFDVGAELASPPNGKIKLEAITPAEIDELEESIDYQTSDLAALRCFILPAGSELATRIHHARSVCRRAERSLLHLHYIEPVREDVLRYLNRLSDWLFVAARTANAFEGVPDVEWNPKGNMNT